MEAGPVINLLFPVGTLAVGSVEPLLENLPVATVMDSLQGLDIHVVILGSAVMRVVAVPGGHIDSELEAFLRTSL